jgi:large subunit ribosomal protein L29
LFQPPGPQNAGSGTVYSPPPGDWLRGGSLGAWRLGTLALGPEFFSEFFSRRGESRRTMEKTNELREMSDEQLELTVKEAGESLFRLRIQASTERLDTPSEIRKNRRLIARVKTIQNERARSQA